MAQFNIKVDMTDLGAQAGGIVNASVLPLLNQAVRTVLQATQAKWAEAVMRQPGIYQGEKDKYVASLSWKMTGDFSGEVVAGYKYADEIETGRPARDLKKYLDTSSKVRRTKDGRRFLIIPFTHQTPGNSAHAPAMPEEIYQKAKELKPSLITGKTTRNAGEVASIHPVWGLQTLSKKHQTPYLMNPATRQHVTVPKLQTQWGEKLSGLGKGNGRYEGMVRMEQSMGGARHSTYMTFRVMMEGSQGWIIPAKPGAYVAKGVAETMQPLAEKVFAEAIRRGG